MEMVVSATYFSKQTTNQIDAKTFIPSNSRIAGDYGFAEYVNNDRAEARGFEISLARETGQWMTGSISYTYMIAQGISSSAEQGIMYYQWGFPESSRLHYLSWDQRHTFKANLNVTLPSGTQASIYCQYHTARPFTFYPSDDGFTPKDPIAPFLANNDRMEPYSIVNTKISQSFAFRFFGFTEIMFYADSRNLFNQKNVVWMDSSARIGGELGDPGGYGIGRRTHVGIVLKY
jgi:outer membrane receptor for ferrienterochelin and colicin